MLLKRPSSLHLICLSFIPFFALTSAARLPRQHPTNVIQPIDSTDSTTDQPSNIYADPQYMVYPVFQGPSLDQIALLMSAVQLMAREAAENINDDIPSITWMSRDDRFSNIEILVRPPSNANTIPRRLMLWALSASLQLLIQRNRFACVKFRITRDGINVGSIEIRLFSQQQQQQQLDPYMATTSPTPPTTNQTLNAANTTTTSYLPTLTSGFQGFNIRVYIRRSAFGYDLPPSAVFGPVITTLHHIASSTLWSRVRSYKTPAKTGDTALAFSDTGRRPFFHKEQLIEAAATVPLFMINKGVFSEVDVEVRLPSEVLIAQGSLRIERTPRPHLRGGKGMGF
ncbi:hypothetical protein G7Y79_00049g084660 [Physcia stellaris]|nr:hypothetical protein G7Y79_00049g084660 [Physcia stellaris]